MRTPLQVTYRHLDASEALTQRINDEAAGLEQFFDGIVGCHVTVDMPHRHHRHGQHYTVRVEISVPGEVLVISRDPPQDSANTDPYAAVNEAFDQARRKLKDYASRLRGDVKRHAAG